MKNFKHLPTKKVSIVSKTGKVYTSTRHYNPDKEKDKPKINLKVENFKEYINTIGKKSTEFAQIAKASIGPEEFVRLLRTVDLDKNNPVIKRMLEHITGVAYLDNFFKKQEPIFQFDGYTVSFNNDFITVIRKLSARYNDKGISVSNELLEKFDPKIEENLAEKILITQVHFLEEYFGKGNYDIVTNALSAPDMYEPYIGAGIWYYKGMDIIDFPGIGPLVDAVIKIRQSKGNLNFEFPKDAEDNLEKLMLGRFTYKNRDKLNPLKEKQLKMIFSKLFNIANYDLDKVLNRLLSNEGLKMKDLLKYMPIGYVAAITDKSEFIKKYMKRNIIS